MVLKHVIITNYADDMFENDVKMYGTQTSTNDIISPFQFENDVKMYGTQTTSKS